MITCEKAWELIILQHCLTKEERKELEEHLKKCPVCREILCEELRLRELFKKWKPSVLEAPSVSIPHVLKYFAFAVAVLFLILFPLMSNAVPKRIRIIEGREIWILRFPYSRVLSFNSLPDEFAFKDKGGDFKAVLWEYKLSVPAQIDYICQTSPRKGGAL